MAKITIINAGNCILCGREIKIVTRKESNKFPNIFFCPRCEHRINREKRKKGVVNKYGRGRVGN